MIGEAAAGLAALNHLKNQILGLKDLNDKAKVNAAVIEIQQSALDLQSAFFELNSARDELYAEVQSLRAQLAEFQLKSSDLDRYELKDFGDNTFAYELKPDYRGPEPEHLLCAHCCGQGVKSILQFEGVTAVKQRSFKCNVCGNPTYLGRRDTSPLRRTTGRNSNWLD